MKHSFIDAAQAMAMLGKSEQGFRSYVRKQKIASVVREGVRCYRLDVMERHAKLAAERLVAIRQAAEKAKGYREAIVSLLGPDETRLIDLIKALVETCGAPEHSVRACVHQLVSAGIVKATGGVGRNIGLRLSLACDHDEALARTGEISRGASAWPRRKKPAAEQAKAAAGGRRTVKAAKPARSSQAVRRSEQSPRTARVAGVGTLAPVVPIDESRALTVRGEGGAEVVYVEQQAVTELTARLQAHVDELQAKAVANENQLAGALAELERLRSERATAESSNKVIVIGDRCVYDAVKVSKVNVEKNGTGKIFTTIMVEGNLFEELNYADELDLVVKSNCR